MSVDIDESHVVSFSPFGSVPSPSHLFRTQALHDEQQHGHSASSS